jgi:hypothetical protein
MATLGGLDIDTFVTQFNGGARSYLFEWQPNTSLGIMGENDRFLVRASKIPATNIEPIIVEYQQIDFKFGGKKKYDDWTISFNVDRKADIRRKFEEWSNLIHEVKRDGFYHKYFDNYKSDETFKMLGKGSVFAIKDILGVKLYGVWPSSIGEIEMDYSNQDFAHFDVTFSYQYHIIEGV